MCAVRLSVRETVYSKGYLYKKEPKPMKQIFLLCFSAFFSAITINAQEVDDDFTVYTKQHGLSDNVIT